MSNKLQILSGQIVAQDILEHVRNAISALPGRPPCVVFIRVGDDGASISYVKQKQAKAAYVGIQSRLQVFDTKNITEEILLREINRLNNDDSVDGILVQAPLPSQIDFTKITGAIRPEKDVDGFNAINCGRLQQGSSCIVPCTPAGIVKLLEYYHIPIEGQHIVIVNRSMIVGKPLANLLLKNCHTGNATVTICHSHTKNLPDITRAADILVLACGKPGFFDHSFVKKDAIIIDVGISRVPANNERGYVLKGDANIEDLQGHISAYTPVPGGIGPLTVAMLMKNTLDCYNLCHLS